jgi:hypothetical protein
MHPAIQSWNLRRAYANSAARAARSAEQSLKMMRQRVAPSTVGPLLSTFDIATFDCFFRLHA